MTSIRDLPLKLKLRASLLATCAVALLLASGVLFWFQSLTFRQGFVSELESLGEILARNSAAPLAFSDRRSGTEVLSSLRAKPQITAARMLDGEGHPFAHYGVIHAPQEEVLRTRPVNAVFKRGFVCLSLPIHMEDARPGRLELVADYELEYGKLVSLYVGVSAAVIAAALGVVLLMSTALQRLIIRPMVALAEVAQGISSREDYSVRAEEGGRDEVGVLTRAFNRMLGQIQARDARVRDSQQRFEVAVMGSSDGLWDIDFRTGAVYYSPRLKEMIGYADHELPNEPGILDQHCHPEDAAALREKTAAYLAGQGAAFTAEFRLRHKDGSYRWMLSRGAAMRDSTGRPVRFAGSHTDVTERRRTEEEQQRRSARALQRQAALLKLARLDPANWSRLIETVLAETSVCLGLSRVSYWSMQPRQQGLLREKLHVTGRGIIAADPVRIHVSELPPHFAALAATGQPIAYPTLMRDPQATGPFCPVSALHAPARRNDKLAGVLVCELLGIDRPWEQEDVEFVRAAAQQVALALEGLDRQRAEAQLRHSELRYRSVVESVQEIIFQTDPRGRWAFLNSAWRETTGYFVEDSLGRSCLEIVHPEDRARAARTLSTLLSGRVREARGEFRFVTLGGETRWIEAATHVLTDNDGKVLGASGTITDITARKAAEAEMKRLNQELVSASRQAGMAEIATGVLHNVGNVLNSVNVSANLVVDQLRRSKTASLVRAVRLLTDHQADLGTYLTSDPKGRQVPPFLSAIAAELTNEQAAISGELQSLQASIDHVKQIVAMQQAYAKVSGVTEPVIPSELVEDALRMLAGPLTRHQIIVEREFPVLSAILTDRHKVLQILVNLINNARQAMESKPDGRRIIVRLVAAGPLVRFEITDNGVGIPAQNLARIFNHGFTTKKSGHGFGLHSCANAAKELGGALSVRSDGPGLGATFILELPATPAAIQPKAA